MKKIWVYLPCYNESPNIIPLTEKWFDLQDDFLQAGYELHVSCIDDKSTDDTVDKIRVLTDRYQNCELVCHEQNKGLGGVLNTAFKLFLDNCTQGDLCVLMDGDNTHDPIYSISMLSKIENGADVVIASRYQSGAAVKGLSGIRQFMSNGAGVFYKLTLGVENVRDYTCGYRMYTYDILRKARETYGETISERRTFACMMEVLYKLSKIGARFDEVPFVLRYDHKQGDSKMRVFRTAKDSVLTAFSLRFG
jgi:dolichol-phosphate mannosyltransferase